MSSPWIRRSLIAAGSLLLLLVLAAALLIARFDGAHYKALAIDWMQAEYQRKLIVAGPVELSVFPRLAVKLSGLRLSEARSSEEFLAVDQAALSVRLLPLLRRQLLIDRVSARGLRAHYRRGEQGTRNFDDLMRASDAAAPEGSSRPGGAPGGGLKFSVSALQFDDLQLSVKDEIAGVEGLARLHSLSSGRLAPGAQTTLTLHAGLVLSRPQAVDLTIDGRFQLTPGERAGEFALGDIKLAIDGRAGALTALSAALTGALAWDGKAWAAGPLQLAVKSGTLGAVVLAPSSLSLERARLAHGAGTFEMHALKLSLAGRESGKPFELTLDAPLIALGDAANPGSGLSGQFKLAGPPELAGSLRSAPLRGTLAAPHLPALAISATGMVGARSIQIESTADLRFDGERATAVADAIDLSLTLAEDTRPKLELEVTGRAAVSARAADWTLDGDIDGARFEFAGKAGWAGAVPEVDATAHFDKLDLNTLLGTPAATAGAAAPPSDAALPFARLTAVDGQFKLTAGSLAYRHYRVDDAKLAASLNDGEFKLERLTGRAWGGPFEAAGSAQAREPAIKLRLDAQDVDANALLRDVAGKDLLEGRGRVRADLSAKGERVSELRASLAGTSSLMLHDGSIKGFNLARALRRAKAALLQRQDDVTQAAATEKTDFTALSLSAQLIDGVAYSEDLDIKSPFLRVGGTGSVDIGRGRINYTTRASVIDSARGQGAEELAALRGLTVPVLLSGPLDDMAWKIQWSGVAAVAIENKLKDKIAEKLGQRLGGRRDKADASDGAASAAPTRSPEEVLRDKLRGLFKK